MDMLIITAKTERWADFVNTMSEADHTCRFAPDADKAVEAVRLQKPSLVLWDVIDSDAALRDDCVKIMMVDVRIHQCAATARSHKDFHEVTEGMGFLPEISAALSKADAAALLQSVAAVEKH